MPEFWQVSRQSQILSHITELAQSMKRDPRDVILPFFMRLEEAEHLRGFNQAVDDFIARIKKRAVEKRKEMDEESRRFEHFLVFEFNCPQKSIRRSSPWSRWSQSF